MPVANSSVPDGIGAGQKGHTRTIRRGQSALLHVGNKVGNDLGAEIMRPFGAGRDRRRVFGWKRLP